MTPEKMKLEAIKMITLGVITDIEINNEIIEDYPLDSIRNFTYGRNTYFKFSGKVDRSRLNEG